MIDDIYALNVDYHFCELTENLEDVHVGDMCWLHQVVCINVPTWRRNGKAGRMELMTRQGELDVGDLSEPIQLPSQ